MTSSPKVLIIVPAYQEKDSLRVTLGNIRNAVPFADIIVVDDGSTDGTKESALDSGVTLLSLPINLGIGGAVQTGFRYACLHGYEAVVQVDADGQHDPADVPRMLQLLTDSQSDIIIGSRFLSEDGNGIPMVRKIGIRYFSWLLSTICHIRITDCSSGLRALNRKAYTYFAEYYPTDFPDAEALVSASRAGLRITETSIKHRVRIQGESSFRAFRLAWYPIKETFSILMMLTRREDLNE